ncbi:hypothetical protein O181_003721 [Austropuccinia psidii MF-1]|uniref:GAF domain-containing protein n=1 Tax=Austropuccinia psidii MF-1 TaxID=1389203 RepID=A0A9Q3GEE2_9BASI|nr:hypothetical protein [Austropuccinia psidii MF-1]
MAQLIGSPIGTLLPYSFFHPIEGQKTKHAARSSKYFYDKAMSSTWSSISKEAKLPENEPNSATNTPGSSWLDDGIPAFSDSEDDKPARRPTKLGGHPKKQKRFARFRHIAFRAFISKPGSNRNGNVHTAELVSKTRKRPYSTILSSWKIKSKGNHSEIKKMVAVVKTRVSKSSPVEKHPKTWDEYHQFYADQLIDVRDPPLPPTEPAPEGEPPTPYQARLLLAPRPPNARAIQMIVNRLGFCGKGHYDVTEKAAEVSKARVELADKLISEGKAPSSIEESWEFSAGPSSAASDQPQTPKIAESFSNDMPPDSLEHHPVFRKIVRECREMFGTMFSMLTVFDEDRQIFLAESGAGGAREAPRDLSFCAHCILSGRKGIAILDTHNDWRYENSVLTQQWKSRFYAGVPLYAPNLDGSPESEQDLCPLGTLCVIDCQPRESFGIEERRKLVYMAEYARREIEKWYMKKMKWKMKNLEQSHQEWLVNLKRIESNNSDQSTNLIELLPDALSQPISTPPLLSSAKSGFARLKGSSSTRLTTLALSPSSSRISRAPLSPSIFEDQSAAMSPKTQKVFDLATQIVSNTLELSLVYLLAVVPHPDSAELGRTTIISAHNLPSPSPVFDAGLHLRALRSPEGGMLYQNPTPEEAEEAALTPKSATSTEIGSELKPEVYFSAVLVPIGSERPKNGGGFVLAGFTSDPKRVFGAEDNAWAVTLHSRYGNTARIFDFSNNAVFAWLPTRSTAIERVKRVMRPLGRICSAFVQIH